MLKIIKNWIYWWKKGRRSKQFFEEELMMAKHREPAEFKETIRQAVINDWKKSGIDITVPNFGGGRQEMEL